MNENAVADPGKATNQTPGVGDQSTNQDGQPEYVSKSEVARVVQDSISAYFRRQERQAAQKAEPAVEEPPKDARTVREVDVELKAIKAERAAEKAELLRERRENAVQAAINSHSLDSDNAELLYDHLMQRHGDRIKVEGKQVYVEDDDAPEGRLAVTEFVERILRAKGDKFRPAPKVPFSKGLKPGGHAQKSVSRTGTMDIKALAKMSDEEMLSAITGR